MDEIAAFFGRTLIVAPHADDEVLGAGGTIARLVAAGCEVCVAVVTSGRPPAYAAELVSRIKTEAGRAHELLGVSRTMWLDMPAAQLTETPTAALNAAIDGAVRDVDPETLLIPYHGDIHIDHELVSRACLVAARPHQEKFPRNVLAYETLSETNWNAHYVSAAFAPNVYVSIDGFLSRKLDAMRAYGSQLRDPPHERSLKALEALATLRGATVHCAAAEGFVQVRRVVR